MSTIVAPTPNSSSLIERQRRVPRLTARARALLTVMNLHFAGVAALAVVNLYLIAHLIFVWQNLNTHGANAIDQSRVQLIAAELAAKPLRGLDSKLVTSTSDANAFYQSRLPYAVSQVAAELGTLAKQAGVRQTRTQYTYAPVPTLSNVDELTEMRIDASVSGDYRPIVHFINAAERDKIFFVVNGINLTGQQTGQVNLRVRMTTYLRAPNIRESASDIATQTDPVQTGGTP
jgi:type IV pilus assembly protein PilO